MSRTYTTPGRVPGVTQGKCITCRIKFLFDYPKRLKDAYCPFCGEKLRATTYLLKWPLRKGPVADIGRP